MADRGRSRGPPIGGAGGGRGSGRGSPAVGHGFQEEQRGRRPTQDHPGPRSGSGPPSQRAASRSPTRGSTELVRSPVQRPATQGVAHADAMIDAQLAQPYRSIEERYGLPRNVDLPAEAYNRFHQYDAPIANMPRPGYYTGGKPINMEINCFKVEFMPNQKVYQYDILIGSGQEKRGAIMRVWESQEMQKHCANWIYDGNRLAWSTQAIQAITFSVDLDQERGRKKVRRDAIFRVQVRPAKSIEMYALQAYIEKKRGWDDSVNEAVTFVNHLLRHTPSTTLMAIKRSFFHRVEDDVADLGYGVIAYKGIYQSFRPAEGGQYVINADVANCCFWSGSQFDNLAMMVTGLQHEDALLSSMRNSAITRKSIERLHKIKFKVIYNNIKDVVKEKTFICKKIHPMGSFEAKFNYIPRGGSPEDEVTITVKDYFLKHYNHRVSKTFLPVVEAQNGALYPMDCCYIPKGQRYPFKLNESQTSEMIKFAATAPPQRRKGLEFGLTALNWANDPMLKHYKMRINRNFTVTKAKLLPPPSVEFWGKKLENPGTNGRWRIDKKQFIEPNKKTLKNWGVVILNKIGRDKIDKIGVMTFLKTFIQEYKGYGGRVENSAPSCVNDDSQDDIPGALYKCFETVRSKCANKNDRPDLIVVIVSGKRAEEYNRIKKNLDCRFGVASQVMQAAHVRRAQTQYIGNVLMKVNAKLGGFSFKSIPNPSHAGKPFTHFKVPTMIIGADVTHPAAGVMSLASMASMTVSMDKFGMKYVAGCESNGHRLEMIQTWTWYEMALPLFRDWMSNVGGGNMPHHVIYLRDGVSESQHQHILQQEVRDIRAVWNDIDSNPKKTQSTAIKYTVAIASKRHHIRFFPPGGTGDRTGNCMPGTLVEHDCTSPTDWDFFLCAHSAIKGTARPAHYHVLLHEAPVSPTDFIQMLYAHSYQYVRSSTPVSQHPAIYYAHLAARRSIAHERQENNARKHKPSEARELIELLRAHEVCNKTGKIMTKTAVARLKELTEIEYPSLLPMVTEGGLHRFMWYV